MLAALLAPGFTPIFDYFYLPANAPFFWALCALIFLVVFEFLALLCAVSPSHALDSIMPDVHTAWADWLHLGKVPFLVLALCFIFGFSASGFALQAIVVQVCGDPMNVLAASAIAFVFGLLSTHYLGTTIGRLIPSIETSAISTDELINHIGYIVTGTAKAGSPSELKVKDKFGNMHYLMIEPLDPEEVLEEGSAVTIVRIDGSVYKGTKVQ